MIPQGQFRRWKHYLDACALVKGKGKHQGQFVPWQLQLRTPAAAAARAARAARACALAIIGTARAAAAANCN